MGTTDDVLEELRSAILDGQYAPRERLVEAEIAHEYGASRFIARKALVQLAAEGLVEIQPNRGARVREISVDEAIALTEVRRALEGVVAARAAERATDTQLAHLRQLGRQMQDALAHFEVVRYSQVNAELHATLREIAAHPHVSRILNELNAQVVQHQFVLALVPGRPAAALREHLAIVDAVCSRDPEAAEEAMRHHIAQVITTLDAFREGGSVAGTGIRELSRKVKPISRGDHGTRRPLTTLPYGTDSPHQVLDLYLPESPGSEGAPYPLVMTIHGGAFLMGARTWELQALPELLDAGFAVASIDYRLSSEAPFPAAVIDAKRAAAHLRRNAALWNLDPSFFAVWGRSAGGYLAAMLGVTGSDSPFDVPGEDASVAAVVDWYGPSDFLSMDEQFTASPPTGDGPPVQQHGVPGSPESLFLGATITDVPGLAADASPLTYIATARDLPPFFLAAGTNDRLIPHQQTLTLAEALRAHGAEVELRVLPDAGHADHAFETQLVKPAVEWLRGIRRSRR